MIETIKILYKKNIEPNDFVLLLSLHTKVSYPNYKSLYNLTKMIEEGYVIQNKDSIVLTKKGSDLVKETLKLEEKEKEKPLVKVLGEDFKEKVQKYRELFPKGKLPSNSPARQNVNSLIAKFKWFFTNYDYTWDDVFKATEMYVKEYKAKNYLYMMSSGAFISKQDKYKNASSLLADYCDMILDGVDTTEFKFNEKVV